MKKNRRAQSAPPQFPADVASRDYDDIFWARLARSYMRATQVDDFGPLGVVLRIPGGGGTFVPASVWARFQQNIV